MRFGSGLRRSQISPREPTLSRLYPSFTRRTSRRPGLKSEQKPTVQLLPAGEMLAKVPLTVLFFGLVSNGWLLPINQHDHQLADARKGIGDLGDAAKGELAPIGVETNRPCAPDLRAKGGIVFSESVGPSGLDQNRANDLPVSAVASQVCRRVQPGLQQTTSMTGRHCTPIPFCRTVRGDC